MRRNFSAAVAAAGWLLAAGQVLAEENAASVLPNYPLAKRQVVASENVSSATSGAVSTLKWRTPTAQPQADDAPPAALNLRVGASSTSPVAPAIHLVNAEEIIASPSDKPASQVLLVQARSRFESQPALDPPSRLPATTGPDALDSAPSFSPDLPELGPAPELELPSTDAPSLELPSRSDPAPVQSDPPPADIPPLADEALPDPGAARGFGVDSHSEREKTPCRENFRDTNCCEQNNDCSEAWNRLEQNPIRGFTKSFLDITPLYRPDVRYSNKVEVDQEKARTQGLATDAVRTWKNVNGQPLGLTVDGTVLGLDGEDWLTAWEEEAQRAEQEIGGIRPARPADLKGRASNYQRGGAEVTITTEEGDTHTLPLAKLSIDDKDWLHGRDWRDAQGNLIARGRFYDYEWNRILVQQDDGRIVMVPFNKLGDTDLCYVTAYWGEGVGLPAECRLRGTLTIRNFTMLTYTWKASGLCHKPLYFEEVQLERYGHTFGPVAQPVVSGAHFFANIAILPYKMGINPCNECQYALGYYRPGDCAPYMIPPVPLSCRGALFEAAAITGAVALFP